MSEALKSEKILDFSEAALDKIKDLIDGRNKENLAVRVAIRGALPGGGYQTEFKFVERNEADGQDVVQNAGGFDLLFEADVAQQIQGAKVDFDESRYSAGFNIEYPSRMQSPAEAAKGKEWDNPIAQKVQDVIDQHINPGVAGHGGWVRLKNVQDNKAQIEMGGGCQGCGLAAITLRQGVEQAILQAVPEIEAVEDLTAHEFGEDPYYSTETAEEMAGASPFGK